MRRIHFALPLAAALATAAGCSSSGSSDPTCTSSTGSALSVCAAGPTVKGVDVSVYQATVKWAQVKAAGNVFAIARVSDGTGYPDTQFAANWSGMKSVGLVRGVYQFFRPEEDPIAQADLMLAKIADLAPGDLPPIMDMEVTDNVATATLQANMKKWLDHVEQKTGRTPMIYSAAFMSSAIGNGFSSYPLWVANDGVTCPTMPSNWAHWKFWQSSSAGTVSGISGSVDMDEFNGTLADLIKFAGGDGAADAGAHDAGGGGADA